MPKQKLPLELNTTTKNRAYWLSRPYIDTALRAAIQTADIILTPEEEFRDIPGPLFPSGTDTFFRHLCDNTPPNIEVEICVPDESYQEVSVNYDVVWIGSLLVTIVALPLIKDLISNYIKERLGKKRSSAAELQVSLKIETEGQTFSLDYKGPAAELADAIGQVSKMLNSRTQGPSQQLPEESQ